MPLQPFANRLRAAMDSPDTADTADGTWAPALRRDAGLLLASLLLAFLVGVGAHMLDYPKWNAPAYKVNGEFLQATHDAYHWLAGSVGLGEGRSKPLALLCRHGAELLDVLPGNFGFLAPAVAAGLAALAVVLLAWTFGGLEGGLAAGAFAVLAPGFFFRTRLGYYDTDMVTLLFPLLLTGVLALWLGPQLAPSWRSGLAGLRGPRPPDDAAAPQPPGRLSLPGMFVFGGTAQAMAAWHGRIDLFVMLLFCSALVLTLLLARPGRRGFVLLCLAVFGLCAFLGRAGLFAASGLVLAGLVWPSVLALFTRSSWPALVLVLAVLVLAGLVQELWLEAAGVLELYGGKTAEQVASGPAPAGEVVWPKVMQSIVEARNIDWELFLLRIHPWPWLGAAGLAGFALCLACRPVMALLLPLFALSLSSLVLGGRMAMFAAPAAALGLGLPLAWLGRAMLFPASGTAAGADWRRPVTCCVLSVVMLACLAPSVRLFTSLLPLPVLDRAHALALQELERIAPEDAMVWTWWDWGYATRYYARRESYADGGRHAGRRIYPLALALTSPSSLQAAQIMKYTALQGYAPWKPWQVMQPVELDRFVADLAQRDQGFEAPQKQYLVVSVESLHLLHWIAYYGSWDFSRRVGRRASVALLDRAFDVNYERGVLRFTDGDRTTALSSCDVVRGEMLRHWDYAHHPGGPHLVLLDAPGTGPRALLLDDTAYRSRNVQLLLRDPQAPDISQSFRLVHDGFPVVRIYEAL